MLSGHGVAQDVCETMADKVGLRDPAEMAQYFGLYESKNGTLGSCRRRRRPRAPCCARRV